MRFPAIPLQHVQAFLSGDSGNSVVRALHTYGHQLRDRPAANGPDRHVVALVMRTEDFASFVSAHPRVLDVVEDHPHRIASDAVSVRRRAQPLAGENCTVILTDVVGFGARNRTDRHRMIVRRESLTMTQAALGPLWDECLHEDRGDGLLVVAPPSIPTARIMAGIHRELPALLRTHNSTYTEPSHIRLRIAVNVGPVTTDRIGMSGDAIIRTARLVEAPALKTAMETTGHGLGIIVSDFVYETAVGHAGQLPGTDRYQRVDVRLKEFQGPAWMRLCNLSPLAIDPLAAARSRAPRCAQPRPRSG